MELSVSVVVERSAFVLGVSIIARTSLGRVGLRERTSFGSRVLGVG